MTEAATRAEAHRLECLTGWQRVESPWSVRRCPHGYLMRYQPYWREPSKARWVNIPRFSRLWFRARKVVQQWEEEA